VKTTVRDWLLAAFFTILPMAAHAEWQAIEKVETYAISGKSGPELYASIGERGPIIRGKVRTIAYTDFKLLWSRKYAVKDDACVMVSAVPHLTIIYRLPKPAEKLSGSSRTNWETFFNGLRDHEKVHGQMIKEFVKNIEAATVGMTVADDAKCVKIKSELNKRLTELFQAHQQRNRDFDRVEMSEGGNIHQLILGLVNGR
jgi:predicted secreted Zn-dependent protease